MATSIIGRHYKVTSDIRALIATKLDRIVEKLFDDVIDVRVVLQVEKYRNICEILIVGKEHDVKSVQESDESMQDAINAALDHVKRQAQKNRKTIRDHHRKDGNRNKAAVTGWTVQVLEPVRLRATDDHNRPRLLKTNNLTIRPMSIEDAAARIMESTY